MSMRWVVATALLLASSQAATEAATYYVDINNPSCLTSGASTGTEAVPYCTITSAQTAHKGAGVTLMVKPGRYREQVSVGASGASGNPFVFQATGPGVIVDGTDNVSSASLWQLYSGDVWVASSVTWLPKQVFQDGQRLTASPILIAPDIPPGTFLAQTDGLYVNLGGDVPSNHLIEAGRRTFGFTASARTWVVIDGFEVMRADNRGIAINAGSDDCVVKNNTVTLNRFQGIVLNGALRALVENNTVANNADHGIYLIAGASAAVVRGNESHGNARPDTRAANGIGLSGATGNTLENNRVHDNQDSGFQYSAGANNNVARQNISWNNGDHGYDHVGSSNNAHIGDIAWGNTNDGFSQEGTAPGNRMVNCISVNNGLATGGNDLWVDSTSTPGFVSDYNIFWNSTGQAPVRYIATTYQTVAAFSAATGLDAHSIQSDPRFHNPVTGLFDLMPGSPAIDAADSSTANWPALDARGAARMDDPFTPDTGAGLVPYADRGAIEYDPANHPLSAPAAALTATPNTGSSPLAVTLDASGSLDYDGAIVSYIFDYGDGSPLEGPQASPTAQHTYATGVYTATVTVVDSDSLQGTASAIIGVDAPPVIGGTFHVDGTNPACSSSGPGTEASPYCTITSAMTAHKGVATTILVHPGRYREQVSVNASGAAGSPYVFQASGPGVIVDGTDDMSSADLWQPYAGDVWVAASATWIPKQVFVDGARLAASDLTDPASIAPGTFLAQPDGLYVNLGGDVPSSHLVEAGRRSFGFTATGRTWIVIDGFEVTRSDNRGIALNAGSDDCIVSNNTVTLNRFQGIVVNGPARALVENNTVGDNADHGIYLIAGATAAVVRGNESYGNARPNVRAANGIGLSGATGNTIENNRAHDNQDSGFQFSAGSDNNLSRQNISWNNGDHGYDHLLSSNNAHIGDVAWGNTNDGFSNEGTAPGNTIVNCIGVNNGLLTGGNNLWVDSTSTAGFVSDHNIFWNETGQAPIRYVATTYPTIAAFTADTGHDAHSTQADPRFHDPANGLFDLLPGSPAIDSAASSVAGWPSLDARGAARLDDPFTMNTGIGPVVYADRGAIEYDPLNHPASAPVAALAAMPSQGTAPLSVTLDASASFDYDGTIVSYTFDFGDGSPLVGPQADPTTTHVYGFGSFIASVTVMDGDGLQASAIATVSGNVAPVAALSVAPATGKGPVAVLADASGSTDTDGFVVLYTFDFGDGTTAGPQASPQASHVYGAGNWTATVTVTDDKGGTGTASAPVTVVANEPPVAALSVTPATFKAPGTVVADAWGSSDPDGRIVSYTFDFGDGSPLLGPLAFGAVTHEYALGTYTMSVIVRDENGDTAITSALITALPNEPPAAALVVNPPFGTAPLGVTLDASASSDSDGSVVSYTFDFGDGSPVLGPQAGATAAHTYAAGAYTAVVTVTDDAGATSQATANVQAVVNQLPVAALTVTPSNGKAPLAVTADASASTDPDGSIVSYTFNFGDGTVVGPQATATAVHSYAAGNWTATVTVQDNSGATSTKSVAVVVTNNQAPNGVIDTPAGNVTIVVGRSVTFTGTGTDPDGDTPLTYRWTFGNAAPASTLEDPGAITFTKVGTYTVTFTVTDARGLADPTPATRQVSVKKR